MSKMIDKAIEFAQEKHKNQKRKYTNDPYFIHLREVAINLIVTKQHENVICAGYLHDTLEDTNCTYDELVESFNKEIADLVLQVTDVSKPEDGNRATRKALDAEHLSKASPEGKTIKLADLISNTRNIAEYDRDFARVYLREKEDLLPLLKGGSNTLMQFAKLCLAEGLLKIKE